MPISDKNILVLFPRYAKSPKVAKLSALTCQILQCQANYLMLEGMLTISEKDSMHIKTPTKSTIG
jgi:hypothetical protein